MVANAAIVLRMVEQHLAYQWRAADVEKVAHAVLVSAVETFDENTVDFLPSALRAIRIQIDRLVIGVPEPPTQQERLRG